MNPADILASEHRLIEQVLNCLERMAEASARPNKLNTKRVNDAVTFFQTFVNNWHFPREEAYLTWAMNARSVGQIETPQFHDHQRCHEHLREMKRAATGLADDPSTARHFAKHAYAYISILMKHHEDEEDYVFPMLEHDLTVQERSEAARILQDSLRQRVDPDVLETCMQTANRLADHFEVPRSGWSRPIALPECREYCTPGSCPWGCFPR